MQLGCGLSGRHRHLAKFNVRKRLCVKLGVADRSCAVFVTKQNACDTHNSRICSCSRVLQHFFRADIFISLLPVLVEAAHHQSLSGHLSHNLDDNLIDPCFDSFQMSSKAKAGSSNKQRQRRISFPSIIPVVPDKENGRELTLPGGRGRGRR